MAAGFFILAGGIVLAAAGVTCCVAADNIEKEAEDTDGQARHIVDDTDQRISKKKQALESSVSEVMRSKDVLYQDIENFCGPFTQIQEVIFNRSTGILEVQEYDDNLAYHGQDLKDGNDHSAFGGVGGAAGGTAAAAGTYNAAVSFGVASTGTAIGTLHGVAAKNAALAFLGGGSKAAGGLGMLGGAATLGVVAVGAGIAILGGVKLFDAKSKREVARANLEQAKAYQAEAETYLTVMDCIIRKMGLLKSIVDAIDARLKWATDRVKRIIKIFGTSVEHYSQAARNELHAAWEIAKAAKDLLDMEIFIRSDGTFDKDTCSSLRKLILLAGLDPFML